MNAELEQFIFFQQKFSFLITKNDNSILLHRCRETGVRVDESLFPAVYNNDGLPLKVSKILIPWPQGFEELIFRASCKLWVGF